MKKISYIGIFLIALLSFWGCEDSDLLTINEDVTQNELGNLSKTEYVLTLDQADDTFETFSWTAPDFGFSAAINYTVQAALAGSNFADPIDVITVSHVTTASITVGEFNKILIEAEMEYDTPLAMEFRVSSVISSDVDPVYSSIKTATVTAYPTTFPPIFMIGAGVGGWDLALAVKMYTTGAPGEYSIICEFINGEAFRFFSDPAWDASKQWNWTFFEGGTISSDLENAEDGDVNLRFVGTTGFYKITVAFSTKTITMEAVDKPRRLLVGSAVPNGWDIGNPSELHFVSDGVFSDTIVFANDNPTAEDPENTFRVFWENDWGSGWNYPYYLGEGYTISDLFEDALDGDNNFRFIGTTGNYIFTINDWEKTVTMVAAAK